MLDGGRKAMVRFDARPSVPYVLPVASFELVTGTGGVAVPAAGPPATTVPEAHTPPVDGADFQVLEALRLGVVPTRGLTSLTVGRHEERARVDATLDRGSGMVLLSGGYGSGKTHMIELAEAEACARGFLVARATFDPVEVPPSHPLRIYGALMRGLVYPEGPGRGLRPLMERLGASDAHLVGDRAHRWLSPALHAVHHGSPELAESTLEFIAGQVPEDHAELHRQLRRCGFRGPKMLALPDYRTFGQVMAHLLGGIAAWSRDAGWKGLVVLLDEAEYLDRLGASSRRMAENVLRYLAMGSLDRTALAFDPEEVYRGGQTVHRKIRPRFVEDQPLVVLCAFTPNPDVDAVLDEIIADRSVRVELDPIRPSLLPVLAEKVFGLVKGVHPELEADPLHREVMTRALAQAFADGTVSSTRQAARMVVEFWDLYRVDPLRALIAVGAAS
jgi:hypothetical protein